jgi:hypothetical protein
MALFFCLFSGLAFALTELPISSATASSTYSSTYAASKAIDKNLTTYWRGASSQTYWWLKLDLGQARALNQISIWWNKSYGSSNYSIQASNDNTSWANLLTGLSSLGGTTNPFQKDHTIFGSFRYVRIYFTTVQSSYPIIYEVKLYGPDVDTTPPTGTIKINNDAAYTNSTSVTLTLSANDGAGGSGLSQMQFSNDNISWSTPEAYATTKTWTLTTGDGTKTVYVKYKDAASNWSNPVNDTIVLDTIAPQITNITPANGATFYENTPILISVQINDTDSSPAEYQFSLDGILKQAWSGQSSYSWVATSGIHNIKAEVRDAGGQNSKLAGVCVFRTALLPPN